jgi:hypothetical protein
MILPRGLILKVPASLAYASKRQANLGNLSAEQSARSVRKRFISVCRLCIKRGSNVRKDGRFVI